MYSAISLLLLTACVKDDLFNTPHPDRGAVVLTTGWENTEEGVTRPTNLTLLLSGTEEHTVELSGTTATLPLLLPGTYSGLIYNRPPGITISGTTATVDKEPDATILATPGYLFAGNSEFAALADDTVRITVPMQQLVRRMELKLTVAEGDPARIAAITGTLSGVAGSIHLASAALSEVSSAAPTFVRSGAGITATLHLLGITGTQHHLTLVLTFTDGSTQTIESDLTTTLAGFNENRHTAIEVSGSLNTPVAGEIGGATITDWQVQDEKDITVQ